MHASRDKSHAGNVANVDALLTLLQSFGSRYNPSQDNLKLPYLNTRLEAANNIMTDLNKKLVMKTITVGKRAELFDRVAPLGSRVVGIYSLCNVNKDSVKSLRSLVRKIQGKPSKSAAKNADAAGEHNQSDRAQTSYMFKVQHMQQIIASVSLLPDYSPNEPDLKLSALEAFLQRLKTANTDCLTAETQLNAARNNRNRALYRKTDGLIVLANRAKKYVSTVFGFGSPESKAVNSIGFTVYEFIENTGAAEDPAA